MIRHDYFICRLNSPYTGSYTVLYSVACSVHFVKFSCLNAVGVKKKEKEKKGLSMLSSMAGPPVCQKAGTKKKEQEGEDLLPGAQWWLSPELGEGGPRPG